MKSDRRHDLESNDLADSAAVLAERLRPYLRTIGLAAAALLVGFAAWSVIDARRVTARQESWDECLAALGTGQTAALDTVVARHPGTPAAQWARLVTADELLDQGSQLLFVDRPQAEQRLQAAAAAYSGLLDSRPLPLIVERATFGLAKARENLGSRESLEQAVEGYKTVIREHPSSAVRALAEERIAALGRESTRQWYDWFVQQKPAPPANADGAAPAPPAAADAAQPGAGQPAAEPSGAGQPAGTGSGTDAPG